MLERAQLAYRILVPKREEIVRGKNEVLAKEYFARLSKEDRWHTGDWVGFIKRINERQGRHFFAVIATGSILRPQAEREHDPEDIDLRILHSSPYDSSARMIALYQLQANICDSIAGRQGEYEILPPTPSYNMQEAPSFRIHYANSLPVHLSYPNARAWDANKYIQQERDEDQYFAELLNPSQGIDSEEYKYSYIHNQNAAK